MRILWLSNSPLAPSGYGGQSALFGPRIRDLGHEVAYAANHGRHTAYYEDIPIYDAQTTDQDGGSAKVSMWAKVHEADLVICLYDSWVMNPEAWPDVTMAIWAPVDHRPMPPLVLGVLHHERVRPIAMSRFGESWMKKGDLKPLYVPHGVDTKVYFPQDDKARCVAALGRGYIPEDAFLVGMVAANRGWSRQASRKAFPEAFQAFARFAKRHPDAYLYVHSEFEGHVNSQQLKVLAELLGIADRVLIPPMEAWWQNVFDVPFMTGVYNALDVLLNPSMSEGFGIPIIEAQACGVPVIVSGDTAMTELCGGGWLVQGQDWWNDPLSAWAFMPFIHSIEEQLENAYRMRGDEKMKQRARRFAETYDADRITEMYWKPTLNALYNDLVDTRQTRRTREREKTRA